VRIISETRLSEFWKSRKGAEPIERARRDLTAWRASVRAADWTNWGDLKRTFGSADRVGSCVVFDVGNNRFRLIARVMFHNHCVYVLKVMDHEEYDRNAWIEECNCQGAGPPKPPAHEQKRSQP
jgi:mRNA interferase HigB